MRKILITKQKPYQVIRFFDFRDVVVVLDDIEAFKRYEKKSRDYVYLVQLKNNRIEYAGCGGFKATDEGAEDALIVGMYA